MLKNLTHPVCNARFYYCYHPGHRCILPIFGYSFHCPSAREILLIDMAERMQLEVSNTEEALNITGDNLSGDEYAERPAVNAYGSPVNVSRIEPRLPVIQSPDQGALLSPCGKKSSQLYIYPLQNTNIHFFRCLFLKLKRDWLWHCRFAAAKTHVAERRVRGR